MSLTFNQTIIDGAYSIRLNKMCDERGFFARLWCEDEFKAQNLNSNMSQCNLAYNRSKGTLRGLHYQNPPFEEDKIVRCLRGEIFDVIVDLRKDSPSYLKHFSINLSEENHLAIYIPKGCAHGLQTLIDNTEVLYFTTASYHAAAESCIRWDDPQFNIQWPINISAISQKDSSANYYSTNS